MATYTTLQAALDAVDTGVEQAIADNPSLESEEDSVYWDMAQAIMYECTPQIAAELASVTGVNPVK